MKKIVVYQEFTNDIGEKEKKIIRVIQPSKVWQGFTKKGTIIDSEARNLIKYLEPTLSPIMYYAS